MLIKDQIRFKSAIRDKSNERKSGKHSWSGGDRRVTGGSRKVTGTGDYRNRIQQKTNRTYGFFFYTPLFFLLSFTGWLWEVIIYLIKDSEFVNRGILFGPWLPIYGCGGIMLTVLLKKWEYKPVQVFFLSMIGCSVLEYLTSFCLERVWGIRWWDYSSDFLNISGRICLWSSLMFGLGGWILICYGVPWLKMLYRKIWKIEKGRTALQLICLILLLLFIADAAWAADFPHMGKNITMSGGE